MNRYFFAALAGLLGICGSAPALADPGYYVVTAYDNAGKRVVDFRYWTVKMPGRPETVWPEIGLGYGVNSRWYTELLASYVGSSQMPYKLSTLNWQNEILLTQGEWPFDLALHAQLIRNHDVVNTTTLEAGPVFQADVGRWQLNANAFFDRGVGGAEPRTAELKYQWQAKYRTRDGLNFGLQGFGELGPWRDWLPSKEQSHRVGPAIEATLPAGGAATLLLQGAFLSGKTYGRQGHMLSLRAAYAF